MAATSAIALGNAKNGGARSRVFSAKRCGKEAPVLNCARRTFPHKTCLHVAEITGYSLRTVEYWFAQRTRMPADALAALIQSEFGLDFVAALMVDQRPRWWRRVLAYIAAIDAQRLHAAARRKIKEALHEDADLADSISRTEAALAVRDADFHRHDIEGLGSVRGSMDHKRR